MTIAKFKVVCMFLLAVLAANVVWYTLFRLWAPHHADNPAVQGLAGALG